MFDKDDNIEISSTKSHNNSSRPESRNLEDRYVNMLHKFHYDNLFNLYHIWVPFVWFKLFVIYRFDYELDPYIENQYNADHYDEDMSNIGGHMMQKFTNNIIHFTD